MPTLRTSTNSWTTTHQRYKIPVHPTRLSSPSTLKQWLCCKSSPPLHLPNLTPPPAASAQPNLTSHLSTSTFNNYTYTWSDLAASLPSLATLTIAASKEKPYQPGRRTHQHPLTRLLGLSLARQHRNPYSLRSSSSLSRSSNVFWVTSAQRQNELRRRRTRLRYRCLRKQRAGLFPWRRRKGPRWLDPNHLARKGRLGWLVCEVARMEQCMATLGSWIGDGAGWGERKCERVSEMAWSDESSELSVLSATPELSDGSDESDGFDTDDWDGEAGDDELDDEDGSGDSDNSSEDSDNSGDVEAGGMGEDDEDIEMTDL